MSVTAKLLSLPEAAELAALRAWHEGLSSRDAVARYLGEARSARQSSRGVIGAIRRDIAAFARSRHRDDLAKLFIGPARKGSAAARAVATAIEQLRSAPVPVPLIGDGVDHWLEPRVAAALRKAGIKTLADLTLRVPRRRRWWVDIYGIGKAGARRIEAFFAAHEDLTDRARALLVTQAPSDVVPWEEWTYGWQPSAAQRLRFLIDFSYSTGLRAGEMVHARLGSIEVDAHGDTWLHVVGKGNKVGKVVLPGLARGVLDRHLAQRGLPVTPGKWNPATPLLGSLDGEAGITSKRLWAIVKRFFATTADVLADTSPTLAEKLRRATPHWMRHTHATHALQRGAELTTVRDKLRQASLSTTSMYLHSDDLRRAKQIGGAFEAPAA